MTTSEYCAPRARPEGRLNIFDNGPCAMRPVFRDYDQKALDDAYDRDDGPWRRFAHDLRRSIRRP